jgi:Domain of unknown function (DUF4372)
MRISNKKLFIDLKYYSLECHSLALNCEEMVNEFWKDDIRSDYGVPAGIRIPTVRRRYSGNYKIKSFSCWDQFLSMAFAQLTYR